MIRGAMKYQDVKLLAANDKLSAEDKRMIASANAIELFRLWRSRRCRFRTRNRLRGGDTDLFSAVILQVCAKMRRRFFDA